MASRKINDCAPELQDLARLFAVRMAEQGIPFMFTCTRRTQQEQDDLWAQGRTKPGKVVTWTRKSKHIDGNAFDIAILKNGKPTWDLKTSVDGDSVADYIEAGEIGESVGLKWGGRFKDRFGDSCPDFPHFEIA